MNRRYIIDTISFCGRDIEREVNVRKVFDPQTISHVLLNESDEVWSRVFTTLLDHYNAWKSEGTLRKALESLRSSRELANLLHAEAPERSASRVGREARQERLQTKTRTGEIEKCRMC